MIIINPEFVTLDYGRVGLTLKLDPAFAEWTIIEADNQPALSNIKDRFSESTDNPIGSAPLRQIISPSDEIVIVTSDSTRPVPNKLLVPLIVESCGLNYSQITILVGTGSHQPHTENELGELFGTELMKRCRIISHNAYDREMLQYLGQTIEGIPVWMNKIYLKADKRIVIGFIEPHFFAGYSGGAKGICPAICGIDTIMAFHSYEIIANPKSDYGRLEDNPQQKAARHVTSSAPPNFLVNVTLNCGKEVTGIYSGDYIEAHRVGAMVIEKNAMNGHPHRFPIVMTTNSGYPLDQNLYQTVKGIWTASRIVEDGGKIIAVSECSKGIPDNGNFARLLKNEQNLKSLSEMVLNNKADMIDRWQIQKLLTVMKRAEIYLYSSLTREETNLCGMRKVEDVSDFIHSISSQFAVPPKIAVLPRGPLTVPFLCPELDSRGANV
jgi:lactate racemase